MSFIIAIIGHFLFLTSQHLYVVVHTDHGLRYSGIGIASVITITYISMYYNVIISWVLFYFVNSFHDPLPWEKCCGYNMVHMNRENVSYRLIMGGNCSDVPTTKTIEKCTEDFTKCVCVCVCMRTCVRACVRAEQYYCFSDISQYFVKYQYRNICC